MPPNPQTPPSELLSITKKFFYIGLFFLPWLWVVNVIYMWPVTKRDDVGRQIKKCKLFQTLSDIVVRPGQKELIVGIYPQPCSLITDLYLSAAGAVMWFIILAVWMGIFVGFRITWGVTADRLTVVMPKGI